jgi:glucokinase
MGWRLVADVGGTNVRFARALEGGRLADRSEHGTAGHPAFTDALAAYLEEIGGAGECDSASIGVAGPVAGGEVRLTNGRWTIREADVSAALGGVPVSLFNDLQAAALAIPWLEPGDLRPVVMPEAAPTAGGARLAVNVGTGFGAAQLAPVGDGWISLPGEPGHMTFGATTAEELALRTELEPVAASVEDLLSGNGLVALQRLLSGDAAAGLHSQEVLARIGEDPAARRSVEIFTAVLARVAGDLVLATAAWGGVYLFGSVALGWCERADMVAFREAFVAKDKMAARMATVPVHAVTNDAAPLIGLARHERPGEQRRG